MMYPDVSEADFDELEAPPVLASGTPSAAVRIKLMISRLSPASITERTRGQGP